MKYLTPYKMEFSHRVQQGDLTLFLQDDSAADILLPIAELVDQRTSQSMRRSVSGCLSGAVSRLFVKTVEIDSLPSRVRVTYGLQRRAGGYDWPVAELMNTVEAFQRGVPVPRLRGFGYRRRGARMVKELFLISDMLDGYVDGRQWLSHPHLQIDPFLRSAFALFRDMHDKQVSHLDLWVGNIMLHPQNPGELKVVDLENCYIGQPVHFPEVLGFQLGFLYFRMVKQYITEARYDQLVEEALQAYPDIDRQRFECVYQLCKHHQTSRKGRRKLLLNGTLTVK